ncbi:MAG TPA: trehalase family glycosidase [bacterium]|nr:trehalase family glycosidase [bacterium]
MAYADTNPFEVCPWLDAASPLDQVLDLSERTPAQHRLGAFAAGNGNVFALLGINIPQNMLSNITGPDYETSESKAFLPVWHTLRWVDSDTGQASEINFTRTRLYRVHSTSIIVNVEQNDNISMNTVTFAPPGETVIYRIVSIANTSPRPIDGLTLIVEAHNKQSAVQTFGDSRLMQLIDTDRLIIGSVGSEPVATEGELALPIGTLVPGQVSTRVLYLSLSDKNDNNDTFPPADFDIKTVLERTRDWWLTQLDGSLSAESSNPRLGGLFENMNVIIKAQQDSNSGGISQMARYSGIWCRDTFGPVRYLLYSGMFDDIKKTLRYYDYATRIRKGFGNRYPLDLDVSSEPPEPDWDKIRPQQGDDPNLLILQYYWYYKATGDISFIKKHYGFMRRNLTGQQHEGYRLPFHGDETYQVWVMMAESDPMKNFFSADTGFEHVAAARAMSEVAAMLGYEEDAREFAADAEKCRDKTEKYYWSDERGAYIPYARKDTLAPAVGVFANINLRPLWIDYAPASDARQRENVVTTAKRLMKKKGTMKTAPRVSLYTGMTPGLLLYNLKSLGAMKIADRAFEGLMTYGFSPTGETAEAYDQNDHWLNYGPAPTVYRSWETAINVESVLYFITGLKYDHEKDVAVFQPYLPPGVDWISFKNLHAGRYVFDMSIRRRDGSTLEVTIKNTGARNAAVELLIEPVAGASPGFAAQEIEHAAYRRKLWHSGVTLAPGADTSFPCGLPEG